MRHIQKVAEDIKNVQLVQNLLASSIRPEAIGLSPMEELQLKYNASNQADIDELRKILSQYLTYPSKQIAEVHAGANRLGILDLN